MFASIRDRPTTPLELDQALQHAVHEKNARSVAELLRRGAYVNTMRLSDDFKDFRTERPTPPEFLRPYLGGPSLDTDSQQRVLHEAYENNDLESTELLLSAGADISRPYHIVFRAATSNKLSMMCIFSKYINFDLHRNPRGETVLYAVIKSMKRAPHNLTDMVEFIISKKANVDVQSGIYKRPSADRPRSVAHTNVHACVGQDLEALGLLMKHGVDINCTTNQGREMGGQTRFGGSPLRLAMAKYAIASAPRKPYHRQFIRKILEYNVDFDFHDEKVTWSWFTGIGRGEYNPPPPEDDVRDLVNWFRYRQGMEYLRTLTTQSAMDSVDVWGKTALHRAVENGQVDQVKLLLENGADYEIQDFWGHTPYVTAIRRHYSYKRKVQEREFFLGPGSLAFMNHVDQEIGMAAKIHSLKRIRDMLMHLMNEEGGNPNAF